MGFINFLIIKMLVKVKFANLINIAANEEIIPELLQSNCTAKNIFNTVNHLLNNKQHLENQITKTQSVISKFRTDKSTDIAASVVNLHLIGKSPIK